MRDYRAIACIGKNREIGKQGKLLFHIEKDLKVFFGITKFDIVVMGSKTWESLPKKPLPYRVNIVLTRNKKYEAPGATVLHSKKEVDDFIDRYFYADDVWIIGGEQIYRLFLPDCDELVLTQVDAEDGEADVFFPEYEGRYFQAWQSGEEKDKKSGLTYRWVDFKRK